MAGLLEMLGKNGAMVPGLKGGMVPGRGGVNRGPGPAPLMGSGNTDSEFGAFQSKTFRGNLAEPEVPLGFAFSSPEETAMEEGALRDRAGKARQFSSKNERISWHSRLLPRHNDVLKNYFREEKRSKEK